MQKEIGNKVFLGNTVSLYDDAGRHLPQTEQDNNQNDAKVKVKKIKELVNTGRYDKDVAKYIPYLLELKFLGMLGDIETREKVGHSSYTDMEQLDFQILLTGYYYINSSNICFPIKIKKRTNQNLDIDGDLITKYGSNKELIPTFSPYEIYQYSDGMLKHLHADELKAIEKTLLYSKNAVYYNDVNIERRNHNGDGITTAGMNMTQVAATKKNNAKYLNIDDRIAKFKEQLKNEHVCRTPLQYFTDLGKINFPTKIDYPIKLHLETEMKRFFEYYIH